MSVTFDPSTDFEDIVDGLEPITLVRRGKSDTSITNALRRKVTRAEAARSDGKFTTQDVRWHFPQAEASEPQIGDRLKDGSGNYFTILSTDDATLKARWVCITRNLAIFHGLNLTITIQIAKFAKGEGGAIEATYTTWKTARAKIEIDTEAMVTEEGAKRTVTTWVIFVADDLEIKHEHRILGPDGRRYKINGVTGKQDVNGLMRIEVSEWRRG